LSISSLNNTPGKPTGHKRDMAFIDWGADLFDASLIGQNHSTDYYMKELSSINSISISYVRIPSENVAADQQHLVQLDCALPEALELLKGKGNDCGLKYKNLREIEDFFTSYKLSNINEIWQI
ncbi:MAG: hypothetical protein ACM3ME_09220, partial [Chloroflexota bacterium]